MFGQFGRRKEWMHRRSKALVFLAAGLLALAGPAGRPRAADPQPYELSIRPTGDDGLDAALAAGSQLQSLQSKNSAGPFALIARARADVPRLETVLRSLGYYDGRVSIRIDGRALDDGDLLDVLDALPADRTAGIEIGVRQGERYRLGRVAIEGPVPPDIPAKLDLAPARPAIAADVLAARQTLLSALREDGYALARIAPPAAVQNTAEKTIDVTFKIEPGERLSIGGIAIEGTRDVNPDFVRRRLSLQTGDLYQPSRIEAARTDLASLGVFSGVAARTGDEPDAEGALPLAFDVQERPKHAVDLTAAYSTDLGGIPKVSWTDRNLFGNAEQLNLSAAATGLGGSASDGLGYNLASQLIKPDFMRRDQSLQFDLGAVKQNLDAYDQDAVSAGTSLRRKLTAQWNVNFGLSTEIEQILQQDVRRRYKLIDLPLGLAYDDTGATNPLMDPTHGGRAALSVTPTESFGRDNATFLTLQASGSLYIDLADAGLAPKGRSVIAFRGLLGSVQGATRFQLPPDRRFYGGGSGTVRGFKYQSVGPLFADGSPQGGTAIDSASVEFRQRLFEDFGAAAFVDAGQVSAESLPFHGVMRTGVGGGVRYYTGIGTLRLDVAVPLNRPPAGDGFELYIGLGQAF
ncbi:autotransporter assembly complex protein TamA [Telmatospirillum siberiense]|nr:BamA/TamA family outer membrane protein [Telmatospirillum siberiense]